MRTDPAHWRRQVLPRDRWLDGRRASEWLPAEPAERVAVRLRVTTAAALAEARANGHRRLEIPLPSEAASVRDALAAWAETFRELPRGVSVTLSLPAGLSDPTVLRDLRPLLDTLPVIAEWRWGGTLERPDQRALLAVFAEWPRRPVFHWQASGSGDAFAETQWAVELGFAGICANLSTVDPASLVAARCWLGAREAREPLGRFGMVLATDATDAADLRHHAHTTATLGLSELTLQAGVTSAVLVAGKIATEGG